MRALFAIVLLLPLVVPALAQDLKKDEAEQILSAVVQVRSRILPNARSAATLGLQRRGSGALIREGYVLTIGYLVIEAEAIEVSAADGKTVPATLAAYDHASGFGLLRLVAPITGRPLPLGDTTTLAERAPAMVATAAGPGIVHVVSRRPFSGSWEYQLDSAIFTYPPVEDWSGAALIDAKGELVGIGSLIVADAAGAGTQSPGNMFVPADLLRPILDDLIASGRTKGAPRPWLGMNTDELRGRLFVSRVSPDGPAARAGVQDGDLVLAVAGEQVSTLAELYRKVWARGKAGVEVPLTLLQGSQVKTIRVRSIDRVEYFRSKPTH